MPMFLYMFGFESPRQFRNNDLYGWDDEDCEWLLIDAPDEPSANAWGDEVAERFVKLLYGDDSVSWRQRGYANWLDTPSLASSEPAVQSVSIGKFPDFSPWLAVYEGEA